MSSPSFKSILQERTRLGQVTVDQNRQKEIDRAILEVVDMMYQAADSGCNVMSYEASGVLVHRSHLVKEVAKHFEALGFKCEIRSRNDSTYKTFVVIQW